MDRFFLIIIGLLASLSLGLLASARKQISQDKFNIMAIQEQLKAPKAQTNEKVPENEVEHFKRYCGSIRNSRWDAASSTCAIETSELQRFEALDIRVGQLESRLADFGKKPDLKFPQAAPGAPAIPQAPGHGYEVDKGGQIICVYAVGEAICENGVDHLGVLKCKTGSKKLTGRGINKKGDLPKFRYDCT